jgi:mono/diheme cytochrome c family protein
MHLLRLAPLAVFLALAAPAWADQPAAAKPAQAEGANSGKVCFANSVLCAKTPAHSLDGARVARGRAVYGRYCVSCHGEAGDGRGYSAPFLDPQPRDFTRGIFKCRSTPSGTLPTDADLLRILRGGIYHSNMPPWEVLGDRQLRDVAEYLKTFSPRWVEEGPGEAIEVPREPADDAGSRRRGEKVWKEQGCFNCHGNTGKGDGPAISSLFDDWGRRSVPFDFTASSHRKCGTTPRDLYVTFMTGLNGTPMPSNAETITPEDAWHLVHYLQTLQRQ